MKILFISMHSIHAIRWIENLKDTDNELYWFDVVDSGKLETINKISQFVEWKKRKVSHVTGEYILSKKFPEIYKKIEPFLQVTANEALEKIILEIQPDILHSFEMQGCSYPILKTMNKFHNIKWLYSCWGNDLYYYQQFPSHLKRIKQVLSRVNYLHTDCQRDYVLAKELGFSGKHVGVIPGGSGFKLNELQTYKMPIDERRVLLVKGYEHKFGRGLNVIKALELIKTEIVDYEVIVFGAHQKVFDYCQEKKLSFKIFGRHELSHDDLLKLMGKSLFYIGNNISDGMPNTLLEAIVMGAFPIQSNPGGVSQEIIENGKNGLLINNSENIEEIKNKILFVLKNRKLIVEAYQLNIDIAKKRLEYNYNRIKIINLYKNNL